MARLSDEIERFIKEMLTQEDDHCELKRNELAAYFGCAPSQINYVLDTRFTHNHGYIIESRRGGGGYIRIIRMVVNDRSHFLTELYKGIGEELGREETVAILRQLHEREFISRESAYLLVSALDTRGISIPEESLRKMRAHSMKNVINLILGANRKGEES